MLLTNSQVGTLSESIIRNPRHTGNAVLGTTHDCRQPVNVVSGTYVM